MRYYHPFPEAIPLSKAGSSRVTHPSATKKTTEIIFSVRLACVRRAASVRPEPGSNSLVKLYIHSIRCLYRSCQLLTDYLCFLSSSLTLSWISRVFCTCSALFNFQDTVLDITFSLPHFRAATFILYHTFELLSSELFVNVFNISWSSARLCSLCRIFEILISPLQLLYYITSLRFCQVNKLWTEILFNLFSFLNISTKCIQSFLCPLTSKASVKFSSLPLRCTLLPASVFLSFPLPVYLHFRVS